MYNIVSIMQELLDATHHILAELEKEHKAQKAPGANAEALKPDADADELREKFRIVRVSDCMCIAQIVVQALVQIVTYKC